MDKIIFFVVGRHGDKIADIGFPRAAFGDYNDLYHVHLTPGAAADFRQKGSFVFAYALPTIVDGYHSPAVRTKESVLSIAEGANLGDKLNLTEDKRLIVGDEVMNDYRKLEVYMKGGQKKYTELVMRYNYMPSVQNKFSLAGEFHRVLSCFRDAMDNAVNNNGDEYENPAIIMITHGPVADVFNALFTKDISFLGNAPMPLAGWKMMEMGDIYYGRIDLSKNDPRITARRFEYGIDRRTTFADGLPITRSLSDLDRRIDMFYRHSKK